MSDYVWTLEEDDSEYTKAIKKLLRESWYRNDRANGFLWNRDSHGLLRALEVVREVERREA